MAETKTTEIEPIVDINYNNVIHRANSEPFFVHSDIAKRLIDNGSAKEVKKK